MPDEGWEQPGPTEQVPGSNDINRDRLVSLAGRLQRYLSISIR